MHTGLLKNICDAAPTPTAVLPPTVPYGDVVEVRVRIQFFECFCLELLGELGLDDLALERARVGELVGQVDVATSCIVSVEPPCSDLPPPNTSLTAARTMPW